MNPTDPDNRGDKPAPAQNAPSLENLMAGIRLELIGSTHDPLQTARATDEGTLERAGKASAATLSVEEIMERLRRELKRRRSDAPGPAPGPSAAVRGEGCLPRWRSSVAPLPIQQAYVLGDMLRSSDGEFVDNAFRILLRRPASASEKAHYLEALRGNVMGKVEVLGAIRFSDEGMRHAVHVDGLLLPYKLHKWRRIPVLGWFLATGIALFRLPRLFAHLQKLEAVGAQESQELGRSLNELAHAAEKRQAQLDEQLDVLGRSQRRLGARLSDEMPVLSQGIDALQRQFVVQAAMTAQIEARLKELDQLEAAFTARFESAQADRFRAYASLEHRVKAELSAAASAADADRQAMQASQRQQASMLVQIESRLEQLDQLEAACNARFESAWANQADAYASLEQRLKADLSAAATAADADRQAMQAYQHQQTSVLTQYAGLEHRLKAELSAAVNVANADRQSMHDLGARLMTLAERLAAVQVLADGNRRTVQSVERQFAAWADRAGGQSADVAAPAPAIPGEGRASCGPLDAHYVSFEDTFRGDREDIKTRASHYLGKFAEAGIVPGEGLVIDLGCGRGEWLEVMSEHGHVCRGVDLNAVMVREARTLGFDVAEQDAVAHLRGLDSDSVAAITSMHLVEHLPYEVLIRMVDEALRVLRPGGVLILETPNPENLTVGSYWFYMDPTHRNPIPPPLLQWIVEARGFEHAAIDRLTQNRAVFDIQPVGEEVAAANQINKIVGLLTAAPDYAIVARKPGPEITHGQGA